MLIYKLLFLFFLFPLFSQSQETVGKVLAVEGQVIASLNEQTRPLRVGEPIYLHDRVTTAAKSRAQIEFSDGSLLNLIPNADFQIQTYSYRKALASDHFFGEIFKGGLRVLTGKISKKNPEKYEFKTPSATLGLRGTIVEINLLDQETYFSVSQGRALVQNRGGSLLIGEGKAQFSFIRSAIAAPVSVSNRPPQLQPQLFTEPPGGVAIDARAAATPQAPSIQQQAPTSSGAESSSSSSSSTSGTTITPSEEESSSPTAPPTSTSGGASIQGGC